MHLCLYGGGRNDFDAGKSISTSLEWALKIETFLGPEMATSAAYEQLQNISVFLSLHTRNYKIFLFLYPDVYNHAQIFSFFRSICEHYRILDFLSLDVTVTCIITFQDVSNYRILVFFCLWK